MPTPENIQRLEVESSPRSLSRWWTEATRPIDTMAAGPVRIEIPGEVLTALGGKTFSLLGRKGRELSRGERFPDNLPMIAFEDLEVEDEGLRGRVAIYPFLGKLAPKVEFSAGNDPKKPGELSFQVKGRGIAWPVVEAGKKTATALEMPEMVYFKEGVIKMLVGDALGVDISSWKLDKGRLVIDGRKVPTSELYRRYHAPFLAMIRKIRGGNVTETELRPRVADGIVLKYLDSRDYQGDDYPGKGAREEKAAFVHYNLIECVLARKMRRRLEQALGVTSAQLQGDRRLGEKLAALIGDDSWKYWFDVMSRGLADDEAQMVIRVGAGEENYDNFYSPRGEFETYRRMVEGTRFDPKMDGNEFVNRLYYGKPDEFDFGQGEKLAVLKKPTARGEEITRGAREEARRRVEVSPQQRLSALITQVQEQLRVGTVDREPMRGNLLELFDLAAEITAVDPAGEQKLVKGLATLLRVAKSREVVFSPKTSGKTVAERRDLVGALVAEAKILVIQPYLSDADRERLGEVMRQLLDHTVALGSGDKMGTALARLLRIAGGKQVKLGGGK